MRALNIFIRGMWWLAAFGWIGVMLFPTTANAQDDPITGSLNMKCLPLMHTDTHIASPVWIHWSSHGVCSEHWCINRKTARRQINTFCGLPSEMPKVGGRLQTILKSSDPLKTANDSPQRFPILPLTDTRFHALRADLR